MVEQEKISLKIRDFLLESFPHQGKALQDSTDLLNDWFVDSLGIIMMVVFIEKTFEINVQSVDVNDENFHSIQTLTEFVLNSSQKR